MTSSGRGAEPYRAPEVEVSREAPGRWPWSAWGTFEWFCFFVASSLVSGALVSGALVLGLLVASALD